MRDSLFTELVKEIRESHDVDSVLLQRMFVIELGFFLAQRLIPDVPAAEAWTLFSGYPFARERGLVTSQADHTLRVARYELWKLRRRSAWQEAIDLYNGLDEAVRGFHVVAPGCPPSRRSLSVAVGRWDVFDGLLRVAGPLAGKPLSVAGPGVHSFFEGDELTTVTLPTVAFSEPVGHAVDEPLRGGGEPLLVTKEKLLVTAREMDGRADENWYGRLFNVEFRHPDGTPFAEDEPLSIDGLSHLLGIVSAGKSTLRDVLTVHVVRKLKRRVTLIVGDVAELLSILALLKKHGCRPAPVIGASNRAEHAQRLHRRLAGRGKRNLLAHDDDAFDYLSTTCLLNAVRVEQGFDPLTYKDAPCTNLRSPKRKSRKNSVGLPEFARERLSCPFWSVCPRHHGSRELVAADVWLATPASLLHASVPWPQNAERIRYLELACRRSDLIIVDEADRVQLQLDASFAPAVPLVQQDAPAWLDRIAFHKIEQLVNRARTQLSDGDVQNWTAAVDTVSLATNRLYGLLVGEHDIRKWLRRGFFSVWLLQYWLALDRYPLPAGSDETADDVVDPDQAQREELLGILDMFRDNPFEERQQDPKLVHTLVHLTSELLHMASPRRTRTRLRTALSRLLKLPDDGHGKHLLDLWTKRFEFTLVLAALEDKLSLLTVMWPRVQAALNLDFNDLYRGPVDYGPVIPESPMGNVIGFQYRTKGKDDGGVVSGELRFFQCLGIGRELLRAMPLMPTVDGRPGPNVLLMSGSSWAATSTRYHIDVPVTTMLAPPAADMSAITDESVFRFVPIKIGTTALRLSGVGEDERFTVLTRMTHGLAQPRGNEPSVLEEELAEIADDTRRRILLLVGSYEEAEHVANVLQDMDRWRGRVFRLVPDAAELEFAPDQALVLRRGDVSTLAETPAAVLVAPLLAVERGHNILNEKRKAAIGSVYFLARPNPRPDDLTLAVHTINDWTARVRQDGRFTKWMREARSLDKAGEKFRTEARREWRRVLRRTLAWTGLGDDREPITWDMLVIMWQVIGRLVRGGVPARVNFVDAAFAPNLAEGKGERDTVRTSLLYSMREVLGGYCHASADGDASVPTRDREIVRGLYKPLWVGLDNCISEAEKDLPE